MVCEGRGVKVVRVCEGRVRVCVRVCGCGF